MAKRRKKETELERLARIVKEDIDDGRKEIRSGFGSVNERLDKVDVRLAGIERRLDQIIQSQLDEHAARIKKLEVAVFK